MKLSKRGLITLLTLSVLINIGFYVYGQSLTKEIANLHEEYSSLLGGLYD